ncbi:hypothetical protein ACLOJK_006235, partial [Asimina triloba]
MAMASLPKYLLLIAFYFLVFLQAEVLCFQYKVGDLDSWGIPTSSNKQIYTDWSKNHHFQIGDSIKFLYPPSQDSVIQVTEQAFKVCNISNPVLYMDDGNSVFNITSYGNFYFTSGATGHCQKLQKLVISVLSGNESSFAPSYAPSTLPASSPSYQNVFGSIPSTSASPRSIFPGFMTAAVATVM